MGITLQILNVDQWQVLEPESIPFTFNTIGWLVLVIVLCLLTISFVIIFAYRFVKNKYRRDAIASIASLSSEDKNELYGVAKILKKLAIDIYGRSSVASLNGVEWIDFLNSKVKKQCFSSPESSKVYESLDNEAVIISDTEKDEFVVCVRYWVKNHLVNR